MNLEKHVKAAIENLVSDGFNPEKLDNFLKNFTLAIAYVLGSVRASTNNQITQEEIDYLIDGLGDFMKRTSRDIENEFKSNVH